MVELIRRVIPRDIVGGDPIKVSRSVLSIYMRDADGTAPLQLKKMDALVHVLYETAGTIAAFTSSQLIDVVSTGIIWVARPLAD
jgi:hypothetical protein